MPNYKTMYFKLLAAQADAMELMEQARERMVEVQQETEELYMSSFVTGKTVVPLYETDEKDEKKHPNR